MKSITFVTRLFCVTFLSLLLIGWMSPVMANEVTLKDKIGQMLIIGFQGTELRPEDAIVQAILAQRIGGVILFDYNFQTKKYERNIISAEQLKALTQQLQAYAKQAAITRKNNLSHLIISTDYEGGRVNRLKEDYGFPPTRSAAEIGQETEEEAQLQAQQMAATLQEAGINLNFAPLLDVNINPDNPIIGKLGRSFSSDPQKVVKYAALFSKAYQNAGILCAYKHFPGHGSSTGDTHAGFVDVTQTWQEEELEPYQQLFQQSYSCPLVMTAHVVHYGLDGKGYPASLSAQMTTGLLRQALHFEGVVVTDDMQMKAITDNYGLSEAVTLAVNAGADMLIFGNQLVPIPQDPQEIVDIIYQGVQSGKISEARIDEAYQRILKLKSSL
ncbi:MAG: nagZ 2 [Gammaproteobacteria bacterium]|jgi:beta-N-acetylhexosaminidase|nr:nagZ 2 [Gammaproteobacteria bacterium]